MRNRNFDGGQPFRDHITRYVEKILNAGRRMHDVLWDIKLGINTRKVVSRTDCISQNKDAIKCCPSPYFRLHQVFNRISIDEEDVFADYGCGVGRVVCTAGRLSFTKVYGIELYPDIAIIAKKNAQQVRGSKAIIEIIEGDVLNFDCKDVTVFFFYDPFGARTMHGVLTLIHDTLLKNPRHIQLVYYGSLPTWETLLDSTSWLQKRTDLSIRKLTRGRDLVRFYEHTV